MGNLVVHGNVKLNTTLPSGTGDNVLTVDSTSKDLGSIGAIDTSTFISTTLNSANIIVGNGSNVAAKVAVTGDVTISNAGVTSIASGVIVNADVNASAAIALTKLAATTASRALVSDGSGFITPATTTATEIGYVNGVTSAIQTQIDGKISTSILTTNGDLLYRNGSGTVTRLPIGANGYVLAVTGGVPVWEPKTPVPNGGATGEYLAKQSATDGDVDWETLTVSKVTDLTASAAELNLLSGVTATTAEINYLSGTSGAIQTQLDAKQATITGAATTVVSSNLTASRAVVSDGSGKFGVSAVTSTELGWLSGATSNIQAQLNNKQSSTLAYNAILVGNASNVATALPVGTNGQVLTVSAGVPTWVTPGTGGTVTSIDVSGGTTGLTFSGGPITTTGTITMAGTLDEVNGGTGLTSYATGDILYASASNTLSKLAAGTNGHVLTLAAGVPSWSAPASNISKATGTISGGATLQNIGSSPVTLIAAPGANKLINIISILFSYNHGGTNYNFGSGDSAIIIFTGGAEGKTISFATMNSATDFNIKPVDYAGGFITIPINTAVVLTTLGGGNASQGNGDIDYVIYYTVEDENT